MFLLWDLLNFTLHYKIFTKKTIFYTVCHNCSSYWNEISFIFEKISIKLTWSYQELFKVFFTWL